MSTISVPLSRISSLLKSQGIRNRTNEQRVRFWLPDDLKAVLLDFINKTNLRPYEELIYTIRDEDLTDDDLMQVLNNLKIHISLLDKNLHYLVGAILAVRWVHRSSETVKTYQGFLLELLSAHSYYSRNALDKFMQVFKSEGCNEWVNGIPTEEEKLMFNHVHDVLKALVQVVPMSCDILVQVVRNHFPYFRRPAHEHESFIYNILKITEYQLQFRQDYFFIIIKGLVTMDVNAPRAEVLKQEENSAMDFDELEMSNMDIDEENKDVTQIHGGMKHPVANSLDLAMLQMFIHVHTECHNSDKHVVWESTKNLYNDIVAIFGQVILAAHATHYVQFVMFYLCSFKAVLAQAFLNFLWRKVTSPNVERIFQQSAAMYLSSLLSRASYINVSMLKSSIAEMSSWIHKYISNQDGLECANSDVRVHAVFYTVCQSLFYVIAFRHSDLVRSKKNLLFLENLSLTKMVTCKLNPLKFILPVVAQNFAAVTRIYQLAYCHSVMEHNARSSMPVIHKDERGSIYVRDSNWLGTFFPFDPFVLQRTAKFIQPLYSSYQKPEQENSYVFDEENGDRREDEGKEDEDDFLIDQSPGNISSNSTPVTDMFSYSSSPGFSWK